MKTTRKIKMIVLLTIFCQQIVAQQDAMFTHYMNNTITVNPGYAGSRDALTITGLHRKQWVNFDGAPVTQSITLHSPLKKRKIGLGLSFANDKIGPTTTTGAYINFAYILKLSKNTKLSLGLDGGLNMTQAKLTNLVLDQQKDPIFQQNIQSKYLPNFGFGIYYYRPRFYAGVSLPKLLENNFRSNTIAGSVNLAGERRHYFFIAGGLIHVSKHIDVKPTGFIKVTMAAPVEADATISFIFNKKLLLGGMFRTGDAAGILVGYNLTEQLHAGYSFDWSFYNRTFKHNQGSHEVVLIYDFIFNEKQRIHSPRYF